MSTFRFDVLTESWVTVAPERRAVAPKAPSTLPSLEGRPCPFCPGNEAMTGAAAAEDRDADGWQVRSLRNRFPVVSEIDPGPARAHPFFTERPGLGQHEVIVETRQHDGDLATYDLAHATRVLRMYRDRARVLGALPWARAVALFRNRGVRSGSSQPHPHAQLTAVCVEPEDLVRRARIAAAHRARSDTPLLHALLARELEEGSRIVAESGDFVVFCPFASHRTYEMRVAPRAHVERFSELDDAAVEALARVLVPALGRLFRLTGGVDYNLVSRDPLLRAPGAPPSSSEVWSFEILPRMPNVGGGLELTTGLDVVNVSPEDAAAALRAA